MILNVSYNNKKIKEKIDRALGMPIPLMERIKMGGIGSPKLIITSCSMSINNLLILDNNRNVCNIEMRPKGIIVGFRSLLESYALVIPYYKLVLYKGKADEYSIYRDQHFVKIEAKPNEKNVHRFIAKILSAKSQQEGARIDDL